MTIGPVILDLEGTSLTEEEKDLLQHPAVGGVIIFSRNIDGYAQLQQLLASVRELRSELLLCVDQEGGRVQRCRDGFTRLPPMQVFDRLYHQDPAQALTLARDCGWLMAAEVIDIGFDLSFAPVLDVDDNFCSVIGDRAFSADAQAVAKLGAAFIEGSRTAGMAMTGKHFPGHGSVRGDSHLLLPVDDRELTEICNRDLVPFERLSKQLDAVMPAHILFPKIDADKPVGFSAVWLQTILRQQLGFEGVVFSDDLAMAGATGVGSFAQRAELALQAGCDMVLVCNHRDGAREVLEQLPSSLYHVNQGDRHRMRARPGQWDGELRQSERWQQVQQVITTLNQRVSQSGAEAV
ncbi:beta-N-acetylhexosaminidase [Pseudomaricurvus alkylphenolicus]|jgi:beta-N-acetylhexosaminidase|uniref:beta-N-acetylhexosaminidase n=1 Tax=Pseudomaricurvus alkylphenolicus TaxID=1306991 RepID=UPI00141DAB20|nr:beta-N-acetylhexosaminidase [Pseudomaricurvus alkylphenolicus]NIB41282.1 beta-N-acetylhexosaminidase [Pseudomaricurvus alkylphenolicus]